MQLYNHPMKTVVLIFAFLGLLVCSVGGFTLSIVEGSYTWHEAKADAEARGGSLAIIDTSLRLDAAQDLLISSGLPLWIGLYDSDQDNSYNWINGNALTVSNFANGQPDVSVERAIRTIGSGEIWGNVGQWMDEDDWKGYGYLLTTVPEPSSYALILGGLALGLVALRRRK
jgi:hypothetical protein